MLDTPIFDSTLKQLLQEAQAIEEANENTTYLGYASRGTTGTSAPNWSILRIQTTGTRTTKTWANGAKNFNLIFDNFASYTYLFQNF